MNYNAIITQFIGNASTLNAAQATDLRASLLPQMQEMTAQDLANALSRWCEKNEFPI